MRIGITHILAAGILAITANSGHAAADIGYEFLTIGDPGNANDTVAPSDGSSRRFGGVDYIYAIGKYDVTVSQYVTFLNAVANADPFGLWNNQMASDLNIAGISRGGSSGNYTYSAIGSGNHPIAYVSWLDAARFCNWLHNGQPTGLGEVAASTEQGAYTLNGRVGGSVLKNANAREWIPTESEWYKAAYYDPNKFGLGVGGYWTYATKSDSVPGNMVGSGVNQMNYAINVGSNVIYSVTQSGPRNNTQNYLTDVGAFKNSASAYGTYDQGGNLWQWNDSGSAGLNQISRGSSWSDSNGLDSSSRGTGPSTSEFPTLGFRIATTPEPTTIGILGLGALILAARRRRP